MSWTGEHVVLPTVAGSAASGGCLMTLSIKAYRRGLVHKDASGVQHRPDFVFVDDPQTNQSARSDSQVAEREHILNSSILRSAGHKTPMSVFVAGTVIASGDLMDRLLDPEVSPDWRAKRVPMLIAKADNETLWTEDYAAIRRNFDREVPGDQRRAKVDALEFYIANREKMDAGCKVAWDQCYSTQQHEISAIQHAYNLMLDSTPESFASECQNLPLKERGDLDIPTASQVAKLQGVHRQGTVPDGCDWLTAFVDVQGAALYWCVTAWRSDFSGYVVDYGVWPKQRTRSMRLAHVRQTLKKKYGSQEQGAVIMAGLRELFSDLGREWKRGDGVSMRLTAAAVDANWPESSEAVRSFCRSAQYGFPVIPAIGRGIGASNAPMIDWPKKEGMRKGDCWVLTKPAGREVRTLLTDTNSWKTRIARGLGMLPGTAGSVCLFSADPSEHREFSEQLVSETPKRDESNGRVVFTWHCPPNTDNHQLDCLVGTAVLASVAGVVRPGIEAKAVKRRRRRKVSY
jgi:hypothetical protein